MMFKAVLASTAAVAVSAWGLDRDIGYGYDLGYGYAAPRVQSVRKVAAPVVAKKVSTVKLADIDVSKDDTKLDTKIVVDQKADLGHGLGLGLGLGHGLGLGYGYGHNLEAYGADNQEYGHQGIYGVKGHGIDAHSSLRTRGHQGQGHNQWVDNAWNQWGVNNHWDNQKSVDNKWGNAAGKVNVNVNSVSGHYDNDYGQQQRGMGYEGHQNEGGLGYQIGLGGHSYSYAPGDHSFGYVNKGDFGYSGWANNLGAWNHGANYDNLGDFRNTDKEALITNESEDTHEIKDGRRLAGGYAELDDLDEDRRDENQVALRLRRNSGLEGVKVGSLGRVGPYRKQIDELGDIDYGFGGVRGGVVHGAGLGLRGHGHGLGLRGHGLGLGYGYDAGYGYGIDAGYGYGYGYDTGLGYGRTLGHGKKLAVVKKPALKGHGW